MDLLSGFVIFAFNLLECTCWNDFDALRLFPYNFIVFTMGCDWILLI